MFEFFQNQLNNEELKRTAEYIERLFELYTDSYISYLDEYYKSHVDTLQQFEFPLIRKGLELDIKLSNDVGFVDSYLESVRDYFNEVDRVLVIDKDNTRKSDNIWKIKQLIRDWTNTFTTHDKLTTHGLIYIHQTVKQTRLLLELYMPSISFKEKTKTHLFEQGLKQLEISDSQYVKSLFSNRSLISKRFLQPFKQVVKLIGKQISKAIKKRLKNKSTKNNQNITWITHNKLENIVRDRLYQGIKYAELAYKDPKDKHKTTHIPKPRKLVTRLIRYRLNFKQSGFADINGKFHLQDNFNGYIGIKECAYNRCEIIIGFSGTNSIRHALTDIYQFIGSFSSAYVEAVGVIQCVWHGKLRKKGLEDAPINVYGHSLGGGLMQFAVSNCSAKHIHGYGYNSAGLSYPYYDVLIDKEKPIYHLYKYNDKVFTCSCTIQVGQAIRCIMKCNNPLRAHRIRSMKNDFKHHQNEIAVLINKSY